MNIIQLLYRSVPLLSSAVFPKRKQCDKLACDPSAFARSKEIRPLIQHTLNIKVQSFFIRYPPFRALLSLLAANCPGELRLQRSLPTANMTLRAINIPTV